eukprot:9563401-Alexandrium_andersonii.AAC.1
MCIRDSSTAVPASTRMAEVTAREEARGAARAASAEAMAVALPMAAKPSQGSWCTRRAWRLARYAGDPGERARTEQDEAD